VRWARQEAQLTTPIIVLTSRCDQASMAAQLSVHDIRVHPKPFSPSRLLEEIGGLLAPVRQGAVGIAPGAPPT
jgi:DNA-binding response OmpR family regulator